MKIFIALVTILIIWIIFKYVKWKIAERRNQKYKAAEKEEKRKKEIEIENKKTEFEKIVKEKASKQFYCVSKKNDWKAYYDLMQRNMIFQLYHFTDRENLKSIFDKGGLFSWEYCLNNNIDIPMPGGNSSSRELDRRKNLQDYVRLSFISDHPMMYIAKQDGRIENPAILKIDPEVVYLTGTKYSDINAATTRKSPRIGDNFDDFQNIDFCIFSSSYFDLNDQNKMKYQAEVLVPQFIPLKYIFNLHEYLWDAK